jgi:hypothetical protein
MDEGSQEEIGGRRVLGAEWTGDKMECEGVRRFIGLASTTSAEEFES